MTINNYLKKERFFLLSSILALFSLVSCQKQPNVTFGSTYLSDNGSANIVKVDTSTVNLSTVFVDSTASSGTGYLQVGRYDDPYFGTITSRAFMQVAPSGLPTISSYDQYDSIGLVLLFKKGNPFYGDSTIQQTFVVNQVDTLYELPSYSHGWFSNSHLPLVSTPLGTTTATIYPNIPFTSQGIGDSLKIRLDDALGLTLYNMIYNKSDTINNGAAWLKWFHGICISPGDLSKGAIYGFKDSAVMRIYYHQAAAYSIQKFIDFDITQKSFQFNNITADRSAVPLKNLILPTQTIQTPPATPSGLTGNAAYIQTATGLDAKVSFPYLNSIAQRADYISVLRATLTVKPAGPSWSTSWTLPPQLAIYNSDQTNLPGAPVYSSSTGSIQYGNLAVDYLNRLNTFYTYDVTNFVKAQITNTSTTAKDAGIIVSAPSPASVNSFSRMVLADSTYPVNQRATLSVYYISLYPHN